jgi:hypothetical protein
LSSFAEDGGSAFAFGLSVGLQPHEKATPKGVYLSAEGWSKARRTKRLNIAVAFAVVVPLAFALAAAESLRSEVTDLIAIFCPKSHVKPPNHPTHYPTTASAWR